MTRLRLLAAAWLLLLLVAADAAPKPGRAPKPRRAPVDHGPVGIILRYYATRDPAVLAALSEIEARHRAARDELGPIRGMPELPNPTRSSGDDALAAELAVAIQRLSFSTPAAGERRAARLDIEHERQRSTWELFRELPPLAVHRCVLGAKDRVSETLELDGRHVGTELGVDRVSRARAWMYARVGYDARPAVPAPGSTNLPYAFARPYVRAQTQAPETGVWIAFAEVRRAPDAKAGGCRVTRPGEPAAAEGPEPEAGASPAAP